MREKGLVPKGSAYMILICSLAMEQRLDDAVDVTYDMLGNSMAPDLLTYKTVLQELCRGGRSKDAFGLLEEWKKRDLSMGPKNYGILNNGNHRMGTLQSGTRLFSFRRNKTGFPSVDEPEMVNFQEDGMFRIIHNHVKFKLIKVTQSKCTIGYVSRELQLDI
ncbi:hypothetical protein V6N13_137807 [Hibiscus sabdariffa]|uniref:Pentatricopeptide repeat-containing protein n=1 Tax=Hibiscus sabdariffa TaxID=183260 RepID=A0ABR2DJI2_9ROSI